MTDSKAFHPPTIEIAEATSCSTDNDGGSIYTSEYEEELKIIRGLTSPSFEDLHSRLVSLGKMEKKFTLFLDLDETLIKGRIEMSPSGQECLVFKTRPYLNQLLERLSKTFEIVVFTASSKEYAAQAVDSFDSERKYIKTILSNGSCILTKEGVWVKDLRIILDRSLSKMLIVDNVLFSYAFQLNNGVPITSYEGEDEDRELEYLATYLETLADGEDIVTLNKANLGL